MRAPVTAVVWVAAICAQASSAAAPARPPRRHLQGAGGATDEQVACAEIVQSGALSCRGEPVCAQACSLYAPNLANETAGGGRVFSCAELASRGMCEGVRDVCAAECDASAADGCAAGFGWDGESCADVDECVSSPCGHGGQCIESSTRDYIAVGRFACICPAGYVGELCATDIDECLSVPCQHGAGCAALADRYVCECTAGYGGEDCQTDVDECASQPCRNGGSCMHILGGAGPGFISYHCACAPGYVGNDCEYDFDECGSQPCQNEGICRCFTGLQL